MGNTLLGIRKGPDSMRGKAVGTCVRGAGLDGRQAAMRNSIVGADSTATTAHRLLKLCER